MQLIGLAEFGFSLERYVIFIAVFLLVWAPWWVLLLGKALVRVSNHGVKDGLDSATICFFLSGIGSVSMILSLMIREFFPTRIPGDGVFSAIAFLSMFSIGMMTFSAVTAATFLSQATRMKKARSFELSRRFLLLLAIPPLVPCIVLVILLQIFPELAKRLVLTSYVWMIMLAGGVVLFCSKAYYDAYAAKKMIEAFGRKQVALDRAMRLQFLCPIFSLPVIGGLSWSAYLFYTNAHLTDFAQVVAAECLWHVGLMGMCASIFLSMDLGKVTEDSIDIIK